VAQNPAGGVRAPSMTCCAHRRRALLCAHGAFSPSLPEYAGTQKMTRLADAFAGFGFTLHQMKTGDSTGSPAHSISHYSVRQEGGAVSSEVRSRSA
jgi:hypothetical protein